MSPDLSKMYWIFALLALFQVKHFVADFPLQREYMLYKIRQGWDFIPPLLVHCFIHGLLTLAICVAVDRRLWWLAGVDFAVHFVMDRIKAGPLYLGRFRDKAKASYWNALGFDQMVHHLTGLYIVWVLVSA